MEGETGEEMFVIARGRVAVLAGDPPRLVATLSDGDVVGERALITRETRNASVRAITHCDMLTLSRDDFDAVMQRHACMRSSNAAWRPSLTTALPARPAQLPRVPPVRAARCGAAV